MMRISENAIDRAFEAFHARYVAKATRAWDLDHHGRLWSQARASAESKNDAAGFVTTLGELRSHWQIARGKGSVMMPSDEVLPLLRTKAASLASKRLSEIYEHDASALFKVVSDVSDIKRVNDEPSLMAISKVLHFFNPRLFVIVDRAMVWDWVLAHRWIWQPIEAVRQRVDRVTGCDSGKRNDSACDVSSYVASLVWCGQLTRENPEIAPRFASFLRSRTTADALLPADLENYESAAVEWLLLGLVELPPPGVSV